MNSKTTGIWFALAAMLFAGIFVFQHFLRAPKNPVQPILPGLRPASVTSIEVIPANAFKIRADRTNDAWVLSQPVRYPAQSAAIEMLLDTLQQLTPATRISASELREHKNSEAEFGFDNPQTSLVIQEGDQSWQLNIGNRTPPGDQVFLRVVGVDGAYVADAGWLKLIPRSADDWRDTALVDMPKDGFDSIILTNGAKVIELHRDPTNHLWRMTRPLQARADNNRITEALQRLQTARALRFVADNPADLDTYGLQPADLDLWLGNGTTLTSAIHLGKPLTNDTAQIYARRGGLNTVVTTSSDDFSAWHGSVNDFRDPHLLELTAPVAEIEVRGQHNFTLQRQDSNDWRVVGEKFPADAGDVRQFLNVLANMRISDFVKDVVSPTDLQAYGLTTPTRQIILRSVAGDSNSVIAQLSFSVRTNGVFVDRADEDFIYAITPSDFNRLPESGWEFRDRHIWNFDENNVTQIILHQNGQTRTLIHNGPNKWSLGAGSQGIINPPAVEETAHRLGQMTAAGWLARNITEKEMTLLGWNTNNLQITVQLKNGSKYSVDFIKDLSQHQSALAAVTLDGERWAFVFDPTLYQFVLAYLTIPANAQ